MTERRVKVAPPQPSWSDTHSRSIASSRDENIDQKKKKKSESSSLFPVCSCAPCLFLAQPMAVDEGMASGTYSKLESKLTSRSVHNEWML